MAWPTPPIVTFGTVYGGPRITPRGRIVWMFRRRQRVRFFDSAGRQVGPEQDNVGPAVAYAIYKGWVQLR